MSSDEMYWVGVAVGSTGTILSYILYCIWDKYVHIG